MLRMLLEAISVRISHLLHIQISTELERDKNHNNLSLVNHEQTMGIFNHSYMDTNSEKLVTSWIHHGKPPTEKNSGMYQLIGAFSMKELRFMKEDI